MTMQELLIAYLAPDDREPSMVDTNPDRALRGEVVRVTAGRLIEMQALAVRFEGVPTEPIYHWHWAAVLNELAALRSQNAELQRQVTLLHRRVDSIIKPRSLECP